MSWLENASPCYKCISCVASCLVKRYFMITSLCCIASSCKTVYRGICNKVRAEHLMFPHAENYHRLQELLGQAHASIDAALYVFTNKRLADILFDALHRRKIKVRLLINEELNQDDLEPNQVEILRRIQAYQTAEVRFYRSANARNLMHHKFCIIDGKILMTGSLNWSHNACNGNRENLVVLHHDYQAIGVYQQEFSDLWRNGLVRR